MKVKEIKKIAKENNVTLRKELPTEVFRYIGKPIGMIELLWRK